MIYYLNPLNMAPKNEQIHWLEPFASAVAMLRVLH